MPPFQPFNYGNVLSQGENILNSRAQRDPNSPQNRLIAAKLAEVERRSLTGGVDPTSNMRDIQFLRNMEAEGYSPEQIDLMKQAIAKSNAWLSPAAVTNAAKAGQTIKGSESLGSTQGELLANEGQSSYAPFSQQSIPRSQIDSSAGGLEVSAIPTKASQQADIKGAEQTATNQANLNPNTGQAAIEAAKVTAGETARASVEEKVNQKKLDKAYKTYEVGISRLRAALEKTTTGFLAGRLPAATGPQQIADQAKAMMLPILKGIVRESGEGVFTDADAKAVLALIPDRITSQDALPEIFDNIDAFIGSKLGKAEPPKPSAPQETIDWNDL